MKNLRRFLLTLFISIHFLLSTNGQCPVTSDFEIANTADLCLESTLAFTNNSEDATSYYWDFCAGDLLDGNVSPQSTSVANLSNPSGFKMVQDNGNWYGFVTSSGNNNLVRLDFFDDPELDPTSNLLTLTGDALSTPNAIDLYKEGDNWYALIANRGNNTVSLAFFGTSLSNNPSISTVTLPAAGPVSSPNAIKIIEEAGNIVAFVTNSANTLTRLNFGSSITATPTGDQLSIPGKALQGVDLLKSCEDWFLFTTYTNSNTLLRMDLGTSLLTPSGSVTSTPITLNFVSGSFSSAPRGVALQQDFDRFYAMLITNTGAFYKIDLGNTINNNSADFYDLTNFSLFSNSRSVNFIQYESKFMALAFGISARRLYRLTFEKSCSATLGYSTEFDPQGISFTADGTQKIALTANNGNNNRAFSSATINIQNATAPDIQFSSTNICVNNDVFFNSQNTSGDINSYNWSFGDGNTATSPNPDHTYTTANNYLVNLTVTSNVGCKNTVKDSISIYAIPSADFLLPVGSICSNTTTVIENNTVDNYDGNLSYEWRVNSAPVSTQTNLEYAFTQLGNNSVDLVASIPGCANTKQEIIDLKEGPLVAFSAEAVCLQIATQFNNTTTGSTITTYEWDFGNGEQSTVESPSYTYPLAGEYQVSLLVRNSDGCANTTTLPVTVHHEPVVDFLNELACSQADTQFRDNSSVVDANITQWNWDFDGEGSATEEEPRFNFSSPGDYTVTLVASSNYDCAQTVQKTITVKESPHPSFITDPACIDSPFTFTNTSTPQSGGTITSNLWEIESSTYLTEDASHTFSTAGVYTAKLTLTGSNFCVSSASETVEVFEAPDIDFLTAFTCANETTQFTENSDLKGDNALSYFWNFGPLGTSEEQDPSVAFGTAGNYTVGLRIETERECVASASKNVEILPFPIAEFTAFPVVGTAPLEVDFQNESSGETDLTWFFNDQDNSTSKEENPVFTYTALGNYTTNLQVENADGCMDNAYIDINVSEPVYDIAITQLSVIENNGQSNLLMTIQNLGSIAISQFSASISLGGAAVVEEFFEVQLLKDQSINVVSTLNLAGQQNLNLRYVCVTVQSSNSEQEDSNWDNNTECTPFNSEESQFLKPFPNPAVESTTIPYIATSLEMVQVEIFDTRGSLMQQKKVQIEKTGLTNININLDGVKKGAYLIRLQQADQITNHKVTKY